MRLILTTLLLLLASPVYANTYENKINELDLIYVQNENCLNIKYFESQGTQISSDDWVHVYTVTPDPVQPNATFEVFDTNSDVDGPNEVLTTGLFVDGCYVVDPTNTFNPTRKQIEDYLDSLDKVEQQ